MKYKCQLLSAPNPPAFLDHFFFYNSRNKGRRKEGTKKRMEEGRQKDKKTQSPDLDRIGIKWTLQPQWS